MHSLALLVGIGALASYAVASTITAAAILPRATDHWIGVDPWEIGLGTDSQYVAPVGTDTHILQHHGEDETKWIGVNTEYLTKETVTKVIDNVETVITSTVMISVTTATAAADGLEVGDVTILMAENFRGALSEAVAVAAKACAPGAKRRRRQDGGDFLACAIDASSKAATGGQGSGAFDLVDPDAWQTLALEVGQNAPELLANAFAVLGNAAARNKLLVFFMGIAATSYVAGEMAQEHGIPGKFRVPAGKVGDDKPKPSGTRIPGPPSSSAESCNPEATPDVDSPECIAEDCKGQDLRCTVGKDKGCRCVEWSQEVHAGMYDKEFAEEQYRIIAEAMKDLPDSVPPNCLVNTNGLNFEGEPKADPMSWCMCTSGTSKGLYPTLAAKTGDPACAYGSMPTETITISHRPKPTGPVTSCRLVTQTIVLPDVSTVATSCTCNDDSGHAVKTKVENGVTVTTCPDAPAETAKPPPIKFPQNEPFNCAIGSDVTFRLEGRGSVTNSVTNLCKQYIDKDVKYYKDIEGGWQNSGFRDLDSITSSPTHTIFVEIMPEERACEGDEFIIDFKKMGLDRCKQNFLKIFDTCPLKGGYNYADCATWSVSTWE
ncbi:hypothetical protein P154DRAFT_573795 [Amniculicola lignicola CBS 123094]|uniref:Uncharacterized protein n=1 Tax=Amniculicola lignicola CBS 123094 TaxID=1392246 RepID=A0A6A5WLJ8_9PLEO|nr:hypothetical protein P154DRAFT_573795 [Amniculicola lignicola CBS 123094]